MHFLICFSIPAFKTLIQGEGGFEVSAFHIVKVLLVVLLYFLTDCTFKKYKYVGLSLFFMMLQLGFSFGWSAFFFRLFVSLFKSNVGSENLFNTRNYWEKIFWYFYLQKALSNLLKKILELTIRTYLIRLKKCFVLIKLNKTARNQL